MAQKPTKSTSGPIQKGEGLSGTDSVDQSSNTWVRVAQPSGTPPIFTASTGASDAVFSVLVDTLTNLMATLSRTNKILALMAIDQGVELPDELDAVFEDDAATN